MKRSGLRRRIFIYFFLLIVFLMFSVFIVLERNNREIILNEGKKRAISNALYLAALSKAPLLMYDYTKLEQNVVEVAKEPDVVYAMILDSDGKVLAHSSRTDLLGTRLKDRISINSITTNTKLVQEYRDKKTGDVIWDISTPIYEQNVKWGVVRIGFSKNSLEHEIAQNRKNLIILALIAIIFAGGIATLLADKITYPIKELSEATLLVSKGDLNRKINIKTGDELEELADTFNHMIDELKKNRTKQKNLIKQLKDKNIKLEEEIKARKQLEKEIIKIERLSALGEMASGVVHDFNNILNVILGRSELLMAKLNEKSVIDELNIIKKAALDGAETVRRIQNFSKINVDESNFEAVDINKIIDDSVVYVDTKLRREIKNKGIQIKIVKNYGDLPEILAEQSELREVFTNLLLNAIDAMPYGGTIKIITSREKDSISIKISDTGIGMSEEVAEKIFEPFFTTKGSKGTGLGLSICYGIIKRHKGNIFVKSKIGVGTTFTILLPLRTTEEFITIESENHQTTRHLKEVLVIDKDKTIRDLICDVLTQIGHEVTGVEDINNEDINNSVVNKDYELIIVNMEDENNIRDKIEKLKNMFPETNIVLILNNNNGISRNIAKKYGIEFILTKPFRIKELEEILLKLSRI